MAKKTVKEPEAQTMGGELIDEPKAKKTTKKAAPKKAAKKTAKKTTKTAAKTKSKTKPKGKTKAEILSKPTKVVRKSVVKNEEHSEFEETDAADIADDVERDELDADDLVGEDETDDSIEY